MIAMGTSLITWATLYLCGYNVGTSLAICSIISGCVFILTAIVKGRNY
jgi:hypothetical protein